MERKNKKKYHQSIDRYPITREWEKNTTRRTLDQDYITWCLENDLPVDDAYDKIKYYDKYEN